MAQALALNSIHSLASPRTQIEMLESSFEDVYSARMPTEPCQRMLDLSANSLNLVELQNRLSMENLEMNPDLIMPHEWGAISNDARSVSSRIKLVDDKINDDWYADDFDLLTWEVSLSKDDAPSKEADQHNLIDVSNSTIPFNIGMQSFESQLNLTAMHSNFLLDFDDSLTVSQLLVTPRRNTSYTICKARESPAKCDHSVLMAAELLKTAPNLMESYTIAKVCTESAPVKVDELNTAVTGNDSFIILKTNESYTVTKGNASYTISTPPMEILPNPGSASKNSSFSEVAEKFHSLRRSMSSDSVLPLSKDKISGMSLTTRALVPTPPLQPEAAVFSAAVADMRLRQRRAPPAPKGPMRAMLPLEQMMRAPDNVATQEPAAKKQFKQVSAPLPAAKPSPALNPSGISTPHRTPPPTRRSISVSPIRRATPVRSPSSGYGQRRPMQTVALRERAAFNLQGGPAQRDERTNIDNKSNGAIPKVAVSTALGSKLKWPSTRPTSLAQPKFTAKEIPKPVLAVANPNVRVSRLKPPMRTTRALPLSVKGKENKL